MCTRRAMEFACYRHFRVLGGVLAIVFVVSGSAQEITVRGDGCARIPPSAPHDLKASPRDEMVILTWEPPSNGACVDTYDIKVTDLTQQDTRSRVNQDDSRRRETDGLRVVIEDLKNDHDYVFEVTAISRARPRGRGRPECRRSSVSLSSLVRYFFTGERPEAERYCDRDGQDDRRGDAVPDPTARVYATPRRRGSDRPPSSPPTTWPPTSYQPPGPPSSLIALGHDTKVTLRWDPPSDTGGCPIEEYSVNVRPVNPTARTSLGLSRDIFSREHEVVIEELENCEPYRLEVRALNCDGWGAAMDVVGTPIPSSEPIAASPLFLGMWCS